MQLVIALVLCVAGCSFTAASPAAIDAATGDDDGGAIDSSIDGPPLIEDAAITGAFCIGTFAKVCVEVMPIADEDLTDPSFDTDTSANCDQILHGPLGPEVCVIIGRNLTVTGTFRAIGARPLVLAAFGDFVMSSGVELSVSSSSSGTPIRGAGANDATAGSGCDIVGVNGESGGGGGAGGSHRGAGGMGGPGNLGLGAGGAPSPIVTAWTFVRGGCPGGRGGNNSGVTGNGGVSGGAVLVIAGTKIQLQGAAGIAASGAGGRGGGAVGGGGGGGGSGGFIGLDAPLVEIDATARVIANGGGGASGAGAGAGARGEDGKDTANSAAGGTGGGASGGDGSVGVVLGGEQGGSGIATAGGGGGGGGGGVILSFAGDPTMGIFSPQFIAQ